MQSKRVDVVSIRMVKEASFLYPNRKISCPEDAKNLFQRFLADMDKEYFVVACFVLGTRYQNGNSANVKK